MYVYYVVFITFLQVIVNDELSSMKTGVRATL